MAFNFFFILLSCIMMIAATQSISFKSPIAAVTALSFSLCVNVGVCNSDVSEVSKLYDIYSTNYNIINDGMAAKTFGIEELRQLSTKNVYGNVLEVAVGTGLQLPYYNWNEIKSFTGLDASRDMLSGAEKTLRNISPNSQFFSSESKNVQLLVGDAESLDFEDNKFDFIVDTFSMCVFDNPRAVLQEMKRTLKPSGGIILLENSRSTVAPIGMIQDILEPIVTPNAQGCRWNVDVPALAASVGLRPVESRETFLGMLFQGTYTK